MFVKFVWAYKEAKIGDQKNRRQLDSTSMDTIVETENMANVCNKILKIERERLNGRILRGHEMHRIREKRKDLRQGMALVASRNIERERGV